MDLFVASATLTGPLVTDITKVGDMLQRQRRALEERESLPERTPPGGIVPAWATVGFYRTWDEAHAALEWIRAWRSGS